LLNNTIQIPYLTIIPNFARIQRGWEVRIEIEYAIRNVKTYAQPFICKKLNTT
jgi:hypothetical protein